MQLLRKLFAARLYYWHFSVSFNGRMEELVVGYPDRLMTSARMVFLLRQRGLPDDAVIISFSYMGKMTETQVTSLV